MLLAILASVDSAATVHDFPDQLYSCAPGSIAQSIRCEIVTSRLKSQLLESFAAAKLLDDDARMGDHGRRTYRYGRNQMRVAVDRQTASAIARLNSRGGCLASRLRNPQDREASGKPKNQQEE